VRWIAASIVERFRDAADEETRAFARVLLSHCKAAIKAMLEPVGDDNIFAAFDGEQIQQQIGRPVNGDDPGPSNHPI